MADNVTTIMEFAEDISTVEAPEPLPVGEYPATIRGAEIKLGTTSGKQYAAVSFYISPEEYPADYPVDVAPDGKIIIYRRVPMEYDRASMFQLRKFCEAINAPMAKKIDVTEWIGLEARVQIGHDTWEGLPREQIERVASV